MRSEIEKLVKEQIKNLKHEDWYNRSAAAEVLGSLGHEAEHAVPALVEALSDEEGAVDWDAAKALVKIGELAIEELKTVPKDTRASWFAQKALYRICPDTYPAPNAEFPPENDPAKKP